MNIDFKEAIQKAKENKACPYDISIIEKFNGWNDFLEHKEAPRWLVWYSLHVIKGRWIEAEPHIMKDYRSIYEYCLLVTKKRWIEAEPVLLQCHEWAYVYSYIIMKTRWLELEKTILNDHIWAEEYIENIMKIKPLI